ncbi:MAG: hypothetical protein JW976_09155 [Syntrophaceae bacterium]|nr:hypothetical protein [Syntrophaceae bacterium]
MVILVAALTLIAFTVQAANPGAKAPSPAQQAHREKMKSCNAEAKAKALKGEERKKFMSKCLKGKTDLAKPVITSPLAKAPAEEPALTGIAKQTQKEKMKLCSAEAKANGLKGEKRKKFMSECLKTDK